MATHSSILTWRIPWTEKPGRLQSMGLHSQIRLKQLSTKHEEHGPEAVLGAEMQIRIKPGTCPWRGFKWSGFSCHPSCLVQ